MVKFFRPKFVEKGQKSKKRPKLVSPYKVVMPMYRAYARTRTLYSLLHDLAISSLEKEIGRKFMMEPFVVSKIASFISIFLICL